MLEYHGIDYEVLEAYPTIAPDLGFGLGLQPDGARILEQLGCYDELKKRAANVEEVYFVGPRGEILLDGKTHGHDLAERLALSDFYYFYFHLWGI
jgi:2-polyprenyl-6-methoxyphenol hydroxylase-like FAD-dependent oxidoreductase